MGCSQSESTSPGKIAIKSIKLIAHCSYSSCYDFFKIYIVCLLLCYFSISYLWV